MFPLGDPWLSVVDLALSFTSTVSATNRRTLSGYLEVVDSANQRLRYIPVPG